MKWCLWLLCVISGVALGAPPDAVRAVTVAAGKPENNRSTVSMVFHVPGNSDGFRLLDGDGKERPMSVMMRNGSRIEAFFNGSPGEKLHLEIYREKVSRRTADAVSGLIHTAKRFDGRTVNSLEEFREAWKSSPLAGAGPKRRPAGMPEFPLPRRGMRWLGPCPFPGVRPRPARRWRIPKRCSAGIAAPMPPALPWRPTYTLNSSWTGRLGCGSIRDWKPR